MTDKEAIVEIIRDAFRENIYPGDDYLQGSFEGSEPYDEVGPFKGKVDWTLIASDFLDARADALSFFSQAGFRFFLPAYLIADLQRQLRAAYPLFHLTHGFSDATVDIPTKVRTIQRRIGRSEFVNPRRYGATTFYDYARYRLSVFTREESTAIVAYLKYRRDTDLVTGEKKSIDAALDAFWLERAQTAPLRASLEQHLKEEEEFLAAITDKGEA